MAVFHVIHAERIPKLHKKQFPRKMAYQQLFRRSKRIANTISPTVSELERRQEKQKELCIVN